MKMIPTTIISHPIGLRGFLDARSIPTVEYPRTMAIASGMNTGSEAKSPVSEVRVSVTATRRIVKTPIASGARARGAVLTCASLEGLSVDGSPERVASGSLVMTGFCGAGPCQSRGAATIVEGDHHPRRRDAGQSGLQPGP